MREEVDGAPAAPFELESWRVIVEHRAATATVVSEATVKVRAGGERLIATGEGNGPVNALDKALRSGAGRGSTRELGKLELADYKVRILDAARTAPTRSRGCCRDLRRRDAWDDRRRARERHRGLLAGADRRLTYGLLRHGRTRAAEPPGSLAGCASRGTPLVTGQLFGVVEGDVATTRFDGLTVAPHRRAPVRALEVVGERRAVARRAAARAGAAEQGRRDRPQLRRARRGDGRRPAPAGAADHLPQAVDRRSSGRATPIRTRRACAAGRPRGRAGHRHRPAVPRRCPSSERRDVVLGYTCANDVTARDLQRTDEQWTRAKGFDTLLPARAVDRDRPRPARPAAVRARSTASCARTAAPRDLLHGVGRADRVHHARS